MSIRLRNPLKLLRSTSFAIDVGSSRTVITTATGDVILSEPTVIAIDQDTGAVLATGTEHGRAGDLPVGLRHS